jgi:hypothetical protein
MERKRLYSLGLVTVIIFTHAYGQPTNRCLTDLASITQARETALAKSTIPLGQRNLYRTWEESGIRTVAQPYRFIACLGHDISVRQQIEIIEQVK